MGCSDGDVDVFGSRGESCSSTMVVSEGSVVGCPVGKTMMTKPFGVFDRSEDVADEQ